MNTEQWAWQFSPAGLLTVRWDNIWIKIPSALTLIAPLCRICYVDDGDAWCRLAWWNLDIMIWHYALASDRVWRRESWAGVWRVSPCSLTGDSTRPPPSSAQLLLWEISHTFIHAAAATDINTLTDILSRFVSFKNLAANLLSWLYNIYKSTFRCILTDCRFSFIFYKTCINRTLFITDLKDESPNQQIIMSGSYTQWVAVCMYDVQCL